MKKNSLILFGVSAVVAVVIAFYLASGRKAETEAATASRLFPGLEDALNSVTQVVIQDVEQTTTLNRDDQGWSVAEKSGYRANVSELRSQLIKLAQAEIQERKTANPELYSRLGVEPLDAEGAAGKKLDLTAPEGEWSLIVGSTAMRGGDSTYVRKPDEEQSYSVSGAITLDADPANWLDRDILDIATPRIQRVLIEHPDGGRIELVKSESGQPNFAVVNIPEGRELLSPSAGNSIAGALSALRLEDVIPETAFDSGDSSPVVATYETFDGVRATARVWEVSDDRYVAISIERDPELAPAVEAIASEEGNEADVGMDGEETKLVSESEVQELNAAVAGWVYSIPSYKFSNLTKKLDDLLKPLETNSDS